MSLVRVASLSQLPADSVTEVTVGNDTYALCNVGGRVTALGGTCLHRGGPLGQGALHGNHVVCPWHAWEWDCQTGANDSDPSQKVPTYAVDVEGNAILREGPERAGASRGRNGSSVDPPHCRPASRPRRIRLPAHQARPSRPD